MTVRGHRVATLLVGAASALALTTMAAPNVVAAPAMVVADPLSQLDAAVAATTSGYLVYQFGADHQIPLHRADGTVSGKTDDARLVVIPHASHVVHSRLLTDTHLGAAARCELTLGARAFDFTWEASELYTPAEASQAMATPAISINANFFDVRPQFGGNTGCSSPLGSYVDSAHGGGWTNLPVTFTPQFAGKPGLTDSTGAVFTALSTFLLTEGRPPAMDVPRDGTDFGVADADIFTRLFTGPPFTAVAGIKLLASAGERQLNDPSGRTSTRTALGYSSALDELLIFQGGNYTTGLSLDDVQNLYRALGADRAIALDGGSSSALVVTPGTGGHWAGQGIDPAHPMPPVSSCPAAAQYCSPIPDPTNPVRPVPSWLGLTIS